MDWIKQNKVLLAAIVAGALVLAWFLLGTRPASAADLGGNCCADLEERIAELEATTARKGNRKVSLEISGHVNKAILWLDDEQAVIDNTTDESRVRFVARATITPGTTAGGILELHTNYIDEHGISFPDPLGDHSDISVRRSAVWMSYGSATGVSVTGTLGKFDTSTHELIDLSVANTGVAVRPLNVLGLKPQAGILDLARVDVRFGSELGASASWAPDAFGGEDLFSAALRYVGGIGSEVRVTAGVGIDTLDGDNLFSASLSGMHRPTGLFLAGSLVKPDGEETAWHLTGGIEKSFWSVGPTTLYGEYGDWRDGFFGASETVYGAGIVQNLAGAMDLYLSYRHFDEASESMVLTGAKVNF